MLSKHYVKKRSIHFVLDCRFEHYKQQEKCTAFVRDIYKELHDDDLFGLLCMEESDLHNIKLEEVGKNHGTKMQLLNDLNDDKNIGVNTRKGLSLAQGLDIANELSKAVPTCTITKRGLKFKSPAKWVVAFLGSQKSLSYQLNLTSYDENTNLLIVCLTNEPFNKGNIDKARQICGHTN
jgi:hypothetical protein